MRYNANGHTDSTWGNNGVDTVTAQWKLNHYSYAVASAVSADGSKIVVDVYKLPAGMYNIILQTGNQIKSIKLLKL